MMIKNKIESSEVKTPRRCRQANECKTVCFITSFKQFESFFDEKYKKAQGMNALGIKIHLANA
ncbi:hypothetical protein LHK12_14555 [Providencia rettgeri]|nr:hypothetical protein [Providencia rettgeri]